MNNSINIFTSILYNMFVQTVWLDQYKYTAHFWQRAWRKSCSLFSGPVRTLIHGQRVIVNYGYTYPIYARKFRSLNNPLVELVYRCYTAAGSAITLIDIGSAVGDTMLLLESNCPGMIEHFYCIDGDPEFFCYLQSNLGHLHKGKLILALLSSSEQNENELVRIHQGTASVQGSRQVQATTLDSLVWRAGLDRLDVLKIDVDGFDGKVLIGSKQTLQDQHPAVIFEWYPTLCQQTSNNWTDHFAALMDCGYTTFVWFTKFGEFSHFTHDYDGQSVEKLAQICLRDRVGYGWHYDIVALRDDSRISPLDLAELSFARRRVSAY